MTLATVSFKTEFAVDMTCQNCVSSVSSALGSVPGIERYDIDLANKQVTITGRTPPSHLLTALKSTNRQVIVRGTSSSANANMAVQAAVAIMESPLPIPTSLVSTTNPVLAGLSESSPKPIPGMNEEEHSQKVFGICRFVQIAPKIVLMDLTVRLPPPSRVGLGAPHGGQAASYNVYVALTGNLVNPPATTGKPYYSLGSITPDKDGYGDMFKEVEGELWDWIGRGCVVEATSSASPLRDPTQAKGSAQAADQDQSSLGRIFAGVVARSAGAWGNDKTVCACSGRTMWEEGREMDQKKF